MLHYQGAVNKYTAKDVECCSSNSEAGGPSTGRYMSFLPTFTFGGLSFRSIHVHDNPILPCREAASHAFYPIRSEIVFTTENFRYKFPVPSPKSSLSNFLISGLK
jgi:hypothetical protein